MSKMTHSKSLYLAIVMTLFVIASVTDIVGDVSEGTTLSHLSLELLLVLLAGIGIGLLLWDLIGSRREVAQLIQSLAQTRLQASSWRTEAEKFRDGLSRAIDAQFEDWQLSVSEREIGVLLLKGFALKEIAEFRQTSERTVRQQAQMIYKKSGINGRTEFAAYFLEDLLVPSPIREVQ